MRSYPCVVWLVGGTALLASALLGGMVHAQTAAGGAAQDTAVLPRVEVGGVSAAPRELKTLNQFAYTQILFERYHQLAPQAELKFKVFARKSERDLDHAELSLVGKSESAPVVLDAQQRFVLDPVWRQLDGNTELRSRLPEGRVAWRVDIQTPGLPSGTRRLGDLRLEYIAAAISGLARTVELSYLGAYIWSRESKVTDPYLTYPEMMSHIAERPVFGVTLVHGERRFSLNYFQLHGSGDGLSLKSASKRLDWGYGMRNRMYRLPPSANDWPDDTLVVLEFMDSPDAKSAAGEPGANAAAPDGVAAPYARCAQSLVVGITRRAEVEQQLGRARVLRFEDGTETWHYFQFHNGASVENLFNTAPMIHSLKSDAVELRLLFDADGVLKKFALREHAAVAIR